MDDAYSAQTPDALLDLSDEEYSSAWLQFREKAGIEQKPVNLPETQPAPAFAKARIYRLRWTRYAAAILIIAASVAGLYRGLHGKHSNYPGSGNSLAGAGTQLIRSNPGMHQQVRLVDGSIVYLFPGSELRIPAGYDQRDRIVTLKGRAFFDIRQAPEKPFIVQTSTLVTTVLGTSFEINENAHDLVSVTVRTGLVAIHKGHSELARLSHDRQIRYHAANDSFAVSGVNAETACNWIVGDLEFENTPLPEICKTLENWYAVTIELPDPKWQHKKVSVKFNRQSLQTVLKVLSLTAGFNYQLENKLVKIN